MAKSSAASRESYSGVIGQSSKIGAGATCARLYFSRRHSAAHDRHRAAAHTIDFQSGSASMTEVKRTRRRATPAGIAPTEPERDILDQYLQEVSTFPLLKGTQEFDLARLIRAGDQNALQELVQRNLRFVISVAKKYQNRGMALIDLIGEGNVGLLTAARKFDPDQGVKFISYAVWWIRQAILSSLARQGRTVRVPLNRTSDLSRIIKG